MLVSWPKPGEFPLRCFDMPNRADTTGCTGFNASIGEHMSALTNPETQMVVVIKVHISVLAAL